MMAGSNIRIDFFRTQKSGKTGNRLCANYLIYVMRVLVGRYAEGYCVANSHDQVSLCVFQAASHETSACARVGDRTNGRTCNPSEQGIRCLNLKRT
jgi:hypothetical protein